VSERRILESWKAIAAYLGRTGKTCRNWEKEYGLPVHRLDGSSRAHVFAYADEIERWKEEMLRKEQRHKGTAHGLEWEKELLGQNRVGGLILRLLPRPFRKPLVAIPAVIILVGAIAAAVLVVAGLLPGLIRFTKRSPAPLTVKTIAVLPFVDLSPDKSQEHIADGIADILINTLNRVEGLRIPGRTSAFYFKGKDVTTAEIGRKLKVEWLLEGSVQVDGNRLRVTASLLRAADGTSLWAERYDHSQADIFAVEDDIVRRVVAGLKVKLMGNETGPLVKPGTANLEAHKLYLQGRYLWGKRGSADLLNAVKYFEKAIDLDPRYALSYAGLSMAYVVLGNNQYMAPREAYPKARAYAIKALELDDNLSDGHWALADVKTDYDWDFAGAEREFKRAIELNPGDSWAHHAHAFLLMAVGKHDEAIKEIRLARDLDPLALRIRANVAMILYFARKYSEAERVCEEELEFEPQNCAVYVYLARVYMETRRFDLALEFLRKGDGCFNPGRNENNPECAALPAEVYARMGKPEEARRIMKTIEGSSVLDEYASHFALAAAYGWLGDKDKAFSLLEKGYAERNTRLIAIKSDPWLDPLRDDPRFNALLRRIGLEP
jgi:adenylate cyclase